MTLKISIMKMGGVIASLVSALALASPAQAIGLTFNWSFDADNGATLGTVSGTISGLQDNASSSSGLTATVLSTPNHLYEGVTFNTVNFGVITVSSGVVTFSNLFFQGSDRTVSNTDFLALGFPGGSNYFFSLGLPDVGSGYYIESTSLLSDSLSTPPNAGTTFSPVTPVPFEFDPSFGLVALGGIWAGRKVIQKIKTSKKSV